jgi:hypothetical protein
MDTGTRDAAVTRPAGLAERAAGGEEDEGGLP